MRERIETALKEASETRDRRRLNTLRLIKTTVKDRDNAARDSGGEGLSEDDVTALLLKMIRQREESTRLYETNGRDDLLREELEEIEVIRSLLPRQLDETEMADVCAAAIKDSGSRSLRDLGKCMQTLKERFPGQMDFGKAIQIVKQRLQ